MNQCLQQAFSFFFEKTGLREEIKIRRCELTPFLMWAGFLERHPLPPLPPASLDHQTMWLTGEVKVLRG